MRAPSQLPPYPPERDRWSFPAPPVGRVWLWAALAAPVLAVALAVASVVVMVEAESRDIRMVLDDDVVTSVVERECSLMSTTVRKLVATQGPPELRGAILADQNVAIRRMLERVGELPPRVRARDEPVDEWLADWERLLTARERWAEAVSRGSTDDFPVPRDDAGEKLTVRMDRAARGVCTVPEAVVDPFAVSDVDV